MLRTIVVAVYGACWSCTALSISIDKVILDIELHIHCPGMLSGDHHSSELFVVERRAFDNLCESLASPLPCSGSWKLTSTWQVYNYNHN